MSRRLKSSLVNRVRAILNHVTLSSTAQRAPGSEGPPRRREQGLGKREQEREPPWANSCSLSPVPWAEEVLRCGSVVHHSDCVGLRRSVPLSSRRTEGSRDWFALHGFNEDEIPPFVGMTGETGQHSRTCHPARSLWCTTQDDRVGDRSATRFSQPLARIPPRTASPLPTLEAGTLSFEAGSGGRRNRELGDARGGVRGGKKGSNAMRAGDDSVEDAGRD